MTASRTTRPPKIESSKPQDSHSGAGFKIVNLKRQLLFVLQSHRSAADDKDLQRFDEPDLDEMTRRFEVIEEDLPRIRLRPRPPVLAKMNL